VPPPDPTSPRRAATGFVVHAPHNRRREERGGSIPRTTTRSGRGSCGSGGRTSGAGLPPGRGALLPSGRGGCIGGARASSSGHGEVAAPARRSRRARNAWTSRSGGCAARRRTATSSVTRTCSTPSLGAGTSGDIVTTRTMRVRSAGSPTARCRAGNEIGRVRGTGPVAGYV